MATSQKYWQKRSLERLTAAEKAAEPYLERVYDIYTNAQKQTVAEIKKFYQTYYLENKWDTQALNRIVPSGDLNRFYESLERAGIAQVLPDRFKGRLNRLEMLNAQMWKQTKLAAVSHGDSETRAHAETVVNGYYRTIFDYSQKLGTTPAFNTLDSRTVEQVLATRFEGANYSERIWRNTDRLAYELSGILGRAIATGQGIEKTSREVVERFNVSKSNAMRLVQTETNYFENRSELEALEEMGIDRFQFLATLDYRTSEMCRAHDKKIYKIKDAKIGDNVPPLHPWCRSTIVAYIGKEHDLIERIARDPQTEQNYFVKGDTDYSAWMEQVGADKIAAAVRERRLRYARTASVKPKSLEKAMTEKQYEGMRELIDAADAEERRLFDEFESEIRIANGKLKDGAYYNPQDNAISLNVTQDARGSITSDRYKTILHESAHNIDHVASKTTRPFSYEYENGIFPKTLKQEAKNAISARLKHLKNSNPDATLEMAKASLRKELIQGYEKKAGRYVSDMFSGATSNEVSGLFGHRSSYWKKMGNPGVATEAFAQIYSASIANKSALSIIKSYFPKTYSIYRDIIKEMMRGKK